MADSTHRPPDSPLKVAVVEPVGGHAGMNYYDIELVRGLGLAGVDACLYTCDETTETSQAGVSIVKPFKNIYGEDWKIARGWRFLIGLVRTAGHARKRKTRIVHLHYFQYGLRETASCVLFKMLGMRVVATAHDIVPFSRPEGMDLFRTVIRLTDHIIVHNNHSGQMLAERFKNRAELPAVSVIRLGNFISNIRVQDRALTKQQLGLPGDQPILLFFGQIKPEKGLTELLTAFAQYKEDGGAGFLLVVGRPMEHATEDYPEIARQLGVSDHVRFDLRYIPDDETNAYYSAADLVVLPYREIYQSAVLIMAMSYGRAVLCSDLPSMKEVVEEDVTGFLFRSGDVDALEVSLCEALKSQERLSKLGDNALAEMQRNYGWHGIGESTKEAYECALPKAKASGGQVKLRD